MLPSGLQMLPLLWLLLWTPEFGHSSPLIPGSVKTSLVHEDRPSLHKRAVEEDTRETTEKDRKTNSDAYEEVVTRVSMVDINNDIYEEIRKNQQNVFIIFNRTELRKAVPDPFLLNRAELHLLRRKQYQAQILLLLERYRKNFWENVHYRLVTHNDTSNWVWFDVTGVVRRWLNQEDEDRGPIEVFCLWSILLGDEEENILHKDIRGLTPTSLSDNPDNDNKNRPFLVFLSYRLKQAQPTNSSSHP